MKKHSKKLDLGGKSAKQMINASDKVAGKIKKGEDKWLKGIGKI
jgi:hypothetical protein